MRRHFTPAAAIVTFAFMFSAAAHDGMHPDAPNPSPNATAMQEVGHGEVTIDYGRPGVKGREGKIWGELVPYDNGDPRPWMAGANGNAVIMFDEDVNVNGRTLSAGSYGVLMIPAEDEWTIIFSNNAERRGIMNYTPDQDALRITATPEKAPFQEWLKYEITKTGDYTADVHLHWENLKVGFTVEAPDHTTSD